MHSFGGDVRGNRAVSPINESRFSTELRRLLGSTPPSPRSPSFLAPQQRLIPRKLAEQTELGLRLVAGARQRGDAAAEIEQPRKIENRERLHARGRRHRI